MANPSNLSIVYNSGLAIKDKSNLGSLAIFYDHIVLPAELARQTDAVILHTIHPLGHPSRWIVKRFYWTEIPATVAFDEELKIWEKTNSILFENGIISRLQSPSEDFMSKGLDRLVRLVDYVNYVSLQPNCNHDPVYQGFSEYLGQDVNSVPDNRLVYMDRYFHHMRQDIILPGIFTVPQNTSSREIYKTLLARNTLKYLLPKVSKLEPEEILEIREAVAGQREGFSMHLQTLSVGVEEQITGNESIGEITRYAQRVIETQLIPDYREFVRILEAKQKHRKGKILDIAGAFLEVDAPIGSPKFFGQLIRALGSGFIDDSEDQETQLSNRNQAYYFMRSVEKRQGE